MKAQICRCCGKFVNTFDGHPIHTACISKHWGKHSKGVNASKCLEFKMKGEGDFPAFGKPF